MARELTTYNGDSFVYENDGELWTDSLRVAARFKKQHKNVLAAIADLLNIDPSTGLDFKLSEYQDSTGRRLPLYLMTETGFLMLASGFTGDRAKRLRIATARLFRDLRKQNELMRQQIARNVNALPSAEDFSNTPRAVKLLLATTLQENLAAEEKVEQVEREIQEQAAVIEDLRPIVESNERLMKAPAGSMKLRESGHSLGVPQNEVTAWVKRLKWGYKKSNGKWYAYASAAKAGYVVMVGREYYKDGELKIASEFYITARGLATLSRKITDGEYTGGGRFKASRKS
jgi:Rha family phage regulatory protein